MYFVLCSTRLEGLLITKNQLKFVWVRIPLSKFGYGGTEDALDFGSREQSTICKMSTSTGSIPVEVTKARSRSSVWLEHCTHNAGRKSSSSFKTDGQCSLSHCSIKK